MQQITENSLSNFIKSGTIRLPVSEMILTLNENRSELKAITTSSTWLKFRFCLTSLILCSMVIVGLVTKLWMLALIAFLLLSFQGYVTLMILLENYRYTFRLAFSKNEIVLYRPLKTPQTIKMSEVSVFLFAEDDTTSMGNVGTYQQTSFKFQIGTIKSRLELFRILVGKDFSKSRFIEGNLNA